MVARGAEGSRQKESEQFTERKKLARSCGRAPWGERAAQQKQREGTRSCGLGETELFIFYKHELTSQSPGRERAVHKTQNEAYQKLRPASWRAPRSTTRRLPLSSASSRRGGSATHCTSSFHRTYVCISSAGSKPSLRAQQLSRCCLSHQCLASNGCTEEVPMQGSTWCPRWPLSRRGRRL